ncbi:hypothetical protein QBC46DRAFT_249661, partial [Diplogelasinospora grovesii]
MTPTRGDCPATPNSASGSSNIGSADKEPNENINRQDHHPSASGGAAAFKCPRPQCNRRENILRHEVEVQAQRLREQAEEIRKLKAEIEELTVRHKKVHERNLEKGEPGYSEVYRICCKEENMSTTLKWVHPDIKFVPPSRSAREGQLVHALSRLDPFVKPNSIPSTDELRLQGRSGLKNVFFWGKRECSITRDCHYPNDTLRILLVSKRFHFIGVHCFYGLNTFAFSSLGELDRFCQGIGWARVDRLQHLELTLRGNQYLTAQPRNNDGKGRSPFSRRIFALSYLPECHRLRTLVVHLNETGRDYMRRRYETKERVFDFMVAKTDGQPNNRLTRCLRSVQGMDYIHTLRSMTVLRFYDLTQTVNTGERVPVKDWSF